MVNINNWTGAAVILLVMALIVAVLLVNPDQLHPNTAPVKAEEMRYRIEVEKQLKGIELQKAQLELNRLHRAAELEQQRAEQALAHEQERHELVMALLEAGLPLVMACLGVALVCLGIGGGYLLYCGGQHMRQPPARRQEQQDDLDGRIVQFPATPRHGGMAR